MFVDVVTVRGEDLQAALKAIKPYVARKTSLPILSHICLESDGESLVLSATDLEVTGRIAIPAGIDAETEVQGGRAVSAVQRLHSGLRRQRRGPKPER